MFPVDVTMPDGTKHALCRVTTDDGVIVWGWDSANRTGFELARGDTLESVGGQRFTLQTGAGVVRVERGRGCGCGHPAKSWRPPAKVT